MSRSLGATHLHLFMLCALAVQFPGSQKFVTKGEIKVTGSGVQRECHVRPGSAVFALLVFI